MKKSLFTLFIFLIGSSALFACKCKGYSNLKKAQKVNYKYSDIVFYGELLESNLDKGTYTIKVNELFKGDLKLDTLYGKIRNSCSSFLETKGKWLIYADLKNDGTIDVSSCSISRSESHPICVFCYKPPRPPKKGESREQSDKYISKYEQEIMEQTRINFQKELAELRKKK